MQGLNLLTHEGRFSDVVASHSPAPGWLHETGGMDRLGLLPLPSPAQSLAKRRYLSIVAGTTTMAHVGCATPWGRGSKVLYQVRAAVKSVSPVSPSLKVEGDNMRWAFALPNASTRIISHMGDKSEQPGSYPDASCPARMQSMAGLVTRYFHPSFRNYHKICLFTQDVWATCTRF